MDESVDTSDGASDDGSTVISVDESAAVAEERIRLPRRYRGFSTSIQDLFLDESIVCGSASCFGLLLSSRTEHLLNERNVKRKGREGGRRAPSRLLGYAWAATLIGLILSYAVWGFQDHPARRHWGRECGALCLLHGYFLTSLNSTKSFFHNATEWVEAEVEAFTGANICSETGYELMDGTAGCGYDENGTLVYYDDNGTVVFVDSNGTAYYDVNGTVSEYAIEEITNGTNSTTSGSVAYYDDAYWATNDDVNQANDDAQNNQDEGANNRKLISKDETGLSPKHNFIGVMKVRDHQEHVFAPAVGLVSKASTNLMAQFKDDELSSTAELDSQLQQRQLGNYSSGSSGSYEKGHHMRTILVVFFLFLLGLFGRRRKMRTRFALLRSRAQDDQKFYSHLLTKSASRKLATPSHRALSNFHEREDKYDGACSHTLFGCYPTDQEDDNGDQKTESCMTKTMSIVLGICCGKLFNCWCQVFSICAIAQEAREVRLLLPPSSQMIDLITHQPFREYAKEVHNLRRRFMENASRTWAQHYAALSTLSRFILTAIALFTLTLIIATVANPIIGFDKGDTFVLLLTFVSSFSVLSAYFWLHKSTLSLDAGIKYFAIGSAICLPMTIILEGILTSGFVSLMYVVYKVLYVIGGGDFDYAFVQNTATIDILTEIFEAYAIAACVEELAKYYSFRMLEHPDVIATTGLDSSPSQTTQPNKSEHSTAGEHEQHDEASNNSSRSGSPNPEQSLFSKSNDEEEEQPELRSLQQQAASITTGMICVASGFAIAECLFYIFFAGDAADYELNLLIVRSCFPVHALTAAMQSINIVRRFIEEKRSGQKIIGVGKTILPAVLLHGTFDTVLLSVNFYIESAWNAYYAMGGSDDDQNWHDPYSPWLVNLITWIGITAVFAGGLGWYIKENRQQMLRLATLDSMSAAKSEFDAPSIV
ncbi:hypothetical protein ACHAWF_014682 [Thalassiosira exigua]